MSVNDPIGDVVVERVDFPDPLIVVRRADRDSAIATELLQEIIDGKAPLVEFGEGIMWFGTDGEGLGRVAYEINDPRFLDWLAGRTQLGSLTIRRIA